MSETPEEYTRFGLWVNPILKGSWCASPNQAINRGDSGKQYKISESTQGFLNVNRSRLFAA
jgi:hypothetical protein